MKKKMSKNKKDLKNRGEGGFKKKFFSPFFFKFLQTCTSIIYPKDYSFKWQIWKIKISENYSGKKKEKKKERKKKRKKEKKISKENS